MSEAVATQPTRNLRRELILLLFALGALSIAGGIFDSTFNNFVNDTYRVTEVVRGQLEFPRELPGFLVALLGGALFFLSVVRLGVFAAGCLSLGFLGLAAFGHRNYAAMVGLLLVWSAGTHLMMPISSSLQLSLAPRGKRAGRLGQIGAVTVAAAIIGCAIVWTLFGRVGTRASSMPPERYQLAFAIAGGCALLGAVFISRLHPPHRSERPKLVLKRRYSLYYLLCVFSGARKQVFVTFGPWVLVKVFGQHPSIVAQLLIVANLISIVFQPQLGKLIDRLGERAILMADAVVVASISLGYGFAAHLGLAHPLYLVYACYVLDSVIFACSIARATYMDKIAETETDVHASLSVGVSIDHAVSMTLPFFLGMLWMKKDYRWVFVVSAGLAVGNLIAASRVRVPRQAPPHPLPEADAAFPD